MNYPDIKYLLTSDNSRRIPVMIEVKGKKRDLIKVNEKGEIDNPKKNSDSNVLTDGPISRINFCTIPDAPSFPQRFLFPFAGSALLLLAYQLHMHNPCWKDQQR